MKFKRVHFAIYIIITIVFTFLAISIANSSAFDKDEDATKVTMAKCLPCHTDLDKSIRKSAALTFNHKVHFEKGIECKSCHVEFPHKKDSLIKPVMQVCYNCHGLNHGKKILAPADCSTCHPKSFNLKPVSHTQNWMLYLHKTESSYNLSQCLMCHKEKECVDCHNAKKLESIEIIPFYPIIHLSEPPQEIKPVILREIIGMGDCNRCHSNLNGFKNAGLVFDHGVHFEKGIRCAACHQQYPHQLGKTAKPEMMICFNCHGLYHAGQIMAPRDCSICHSKIVLKPASHTSEWRPKLHSIEAKKDRDKCISCHEITFCQKCHGLEEIPHPIDWKPKLHKIKAIEKEKVCYQCHGEDFVFCDKCHHKEYGPPTGYWWSKTPGLSNHPKVVKEQGAAGCIECHGPTYCAKCHISGEKPTGGELGPPSL